MYMSLNSIQEKIIVLSNMSVASQNLGDFASFIVPIWDNKEKLRPGMIFKAVERLENR